MKLQGSFNKVEKTLKGIKSINSQVANKESCVLIYTKNNVVYIAFNLLLNNEKNNEKMFITVKTDINILEDSKDVYQLSLLDFEKIVKTLNKCIGIIDIDFVLKISGLINIEVPISIVDDLEDTIYVNEGFTVDNFTRVYEGKTTDFNKSLKYHIKMLKSSLKTNKYNSTLCSLNLNGDYKRLESTNGHKAYITRDNNIKGTVLLSLENCRIFENIMKYTSKELKYNGLDLNLIIEKTDKNIYINISNDINIIVENENFNKNYLNLNQMMLELDSKINTKGLQELRNYIQEIFKIYKESELLKSENFILMYNDFEQKVLKFKFRNIEKIIKVDFTNYTCEAKKSYIEVFNPVYIKDLLESINIDCNDTVDFYMNSERTPIYIDDEVNMNILLPMHLENMNDRDDIIREMSR